MSLDTVQSAHPRPVGTLVALAKDLTETLGGIPSRNRLMREFKIGAPKADAIRAELARPNPGTDTGPEADPTESEVEVARVGNLVRNGHRGIASTDTPTGIAAPDPVADPTDTRVPDGPVTPVDQQTAPEPSSLPGPDGHPGTATESKPRPVVVWPVMLLMLPAFVAVWAGWVGLGRYTGFGVVNLLPGIAPDGGFATIDSAITLPVGMEVYAAYALYVWLSGRVPDRARRFAMGSALVALSVGALGQVAYHLLAAPPGGAPWPITTAVACLPVAVLGMGAALAHMVREDVTR